MNEEGINVSEHALARAGLPTDPRYLFIPWEKIRVIDIYSHSEGYSLSIKANISEPARIRLRNADGGFPRDPDNCVDLQLAVNRGEGKRAAARLNEGLRDSLSLDGGLHTHD